jgi:hypothetical protein
MGATRATSVALLSGNGGYQWTQGTKGEQRDKVARAREGRS